MDKTRLLLTILIPIALGGCGFQLAGTAPSDIGLKHVYVDNQVDIQQLIDRPVSNQLTDDLSSLSTQVFNKAQSNTAGLIITNEENIERALSLTSGLFERQVELGKRVHYQILDQSGNILAIDSISSYRELIEDSSSPAAKHAEREILIDAINRDISRQLIKRLSAALTQAAVSTTK